MKASVIFLWLLVLPVWASQPVKMPPPEQALIIDYFGGFTGFDRSGYTAMRSVAGQMVAEGTLAHFVTMEAGKSGGGRYCLELSPEAQESLDEVTGIFARFHPQDEVTVFKLTKTPYCSLRKGD